MRVQVPHRVSVTRARIRLPQVAGDRREDQQNQMVQEAERVTLPALDKRQDDQAMEGV